MNLGGEDRYESMDSDKKPRAGQILWIRGLTRLQTQVSVTHFQNGRTRPETTQSPLFPSHLFRFVLRVCAHMANRPVHARASLHVQRKHTEQSNEINFLYFVLRRGPLSRWGTFLLGEPL